MLTKIDFNVMHKNYAKMCKFMTLATFRIRAIFSNFRHFFEFWQYYVVQITEIDFDHTHLLGETVEEITEEKCGIIKKETPNTTINTKENIASVIRKFSIKQNTDTNFINKQSIVFRILSVDTKQSGNWNTWKCTTVLVYYSYCIVLDWKKTTYQCFIFQRYIRCKFRIIF